MNDRATELPSPAIVPAHVLDIPPEMFDQGGSKALLFNTANMALVELDAGEYWVYKRWRSGMILAAEDASLIAALLSSGVFESSAVLGSGRALLLDNVPEEASLRVVLIPTLRCNLSCSYCYHGGSVDGRMSQESPARVVEAVAGFASNYPTLNRLTVVWHGGEPLTALDRITEISRGLQEYCADRRAEYEESLLTNGTLLSQQVVDKILADTAVNELQVSIDEARRLGKLDRVIDGVRSLCSSSDRISVFLKYNVAEPDFSFLEELLPQLEPIASLNGVFLRFGFLESHGDIKTGRAMSYAEFVRGYWGMAERLRGMGLGWEPELPRPIGSVCVADDPEAITIGPDLGLYRCNVNAHDSKWKTGNVSELPAIHTSGVHDRGESASFLDYDALGDPECSRCSVMPLCLGGCHVKRIHGDRDADFCDGTRTRVALQVADFAKSVNEGG